MDVKTETETHFQQNYQNMVPVSRGEFKLFSERLGRIIRLAIEDLTSSVEKRLTSMENTLSARLEAKREFTDADQRAIVKDVLKGIRQPKDGATPVIDYARAAAMAADLIVPPAPLTPTNGRDADESAIAARLRAQLTPEILARIQADLPALAYAMRDSLELLPEGEKIKSTAIADIEPYVKSLIEKYGAYLGSGGQSSVQILLAGALKAQQAQALNFTGAGKPTVTNGANGVLNLDFSASGSTGFQAPTSGPVDGSNKIFVFATAPNAVCVDGGRVMQKTNTDLTANWTGTTTITLAVAPNFDIFALA